jgi:hypothetical protein
VLGAIIDARAAAGGPRGFVTGLHAAMWVSGAALFGAAALTAVLLRPATVRRITANDASTGTTDIEPILRW